MTVRIVLWSLADAEASHHELVDKLPQLEEPSSWLWNEVTERFRALVVDEDDEAEALAAAQSLIGRPPDVYEEFDTA